MAELILSAREGVYRTVSSNWPTKFEKRHAGLKRQWTKMIDKAQAQGMVPEKVEKSTLTL